MKTIKCDLCKKSCNEDTGRYEAQVIFKKYPYLYYSADAKEHPAWDLCKSCWEKCDKVWKDFIGWKPPVEETLSDDDWGKDGSTMATDSWGGAGPDCISVPG